MLYDHTLDEIMTNTNIGVEYEIALFYKLLEHKPQEQASVMEAIKARIDCPKIEEIIDRTDTGKIIKALKAKGLTYADSTFETQNDGVGPSDVVLYAEDSEGNVCRIGLSVKYSNKCSLNLTGRNFLTEEQIAILTERYVKIYLPQFLEYMQIRYGHVKNWHRKRSVPNDHMIDDIRDAVISNWPEIQDKESIMSSIFHEASPIEFWVVKYNKKGYTLQTLPPSFDLTRSADIKIEKHCTSAIAFYLDGVMFGKMQVKFNNGFIESNLNRKGERKKKVCDFIQDGLEYNYGKPFVSWNFYIEKSK